MSYYIILYFIITLYHICPDAGDNIVAGITAWHKLSRSRSTGPTQLLWIKPFIPPSTEVGDIWIGFDISVQSLN